LCVYNAMYRVVYITLISNSFPVSFNSFKYAYFLLFE